MLSQAFPSGQQMTASVPVLLSGKHCVPIGQHQDEGWLGPQVVRLVRPLQVTSLSIRLAKDGKWNGVARAEGSQGARPKRAHRRDGRMACGGEAKVEAVSEDEGRFQDYGRGKEAKKGIMSGRRKRRWNACYWCSCCAGTPPCICLEESIPLGCQETMAEGP